MTRNGITTAVRWPYATGLLAAIALLLGAAGPAGAWIELDPGEDYLYDPHGVLVVDGSYVMNAGNLHIHLSNWGGLIGSYPGSRFPFSEQPSAQWPAGSGDEYLFAAGLWVGGVLLGERLVSTGQYQTEMRPLPNPEDTMYEAIGTKLVRPPGNDIASGRRFPEPNPNDDEDVDEFGRERIDEETLNGYDDDGDGLIDEDFAQIGNQMVVMTLYDNTRTAQEIFPDHTPLNIRVVQEAYAWENDQVNDFVGFEYTITNVGVTDITNIYIGLFADADVANRSNPAGYRDDLVGSFSGAVRASDGTFVPVEVGYMYDAPEEGDKLSGYMGVAFLGHATDPAGVRAPRTVGLRTFRHFSGQAPFDQGGDPTNDLERYETLSSGARDGNAPVGKEDDYRFIVAAGPFSRLRPDENLTFQVAIVLGEGLEGMLRNCAEAMLTFYGAYFDRVPNYPSLNDPSLTIQTGFNGRESIVCREDFANPAEFDQIYPDVGDPTCVSTDYLLNNFQPVQPEDLFQIPDPLNPGRTKTCVMVNMDNCFECFRRKPFPSNFYQFAPDEARCTQYDIETFWNCWQTDVDDRDKQGCTGIGGAESQVRWLVGMAPPAPGLRLWPTDRHVHLFWDNSSEVTPDVRLNEIDFQSYRIWRADNWARPFGSSLENGPGSNLWQLVAEYDMVDSFVVDYFNQQGQLVGQDTLPLGRNTGLESIRYVPRCLGDPLFAGLAEAMQEVVDNDPAGIYTDRPPLYDRLGVPLPISEPLLPWQAYPDVLDTFWTVTARPDTTYTDPDSGELVVIVGKEPKWYYEYIDPFVHNGFLYFYSVTATDHEMELIPGTNPPQYRIRGTGLAGHPSSSFDNTSPATFAQTAEERDRQGANIYVYPNPATRAALAEFQQLSPDENDPTGVRVRWANLPAARNSIKVFTLAGDLVQTIEHDGTGGYGEAGWNLISRNGQEIVSGIYLYVVQSSDSRFEDFIGKFVVVR